MKILQIVPSYKPAYVYGGPIESVAKLSEGLVNDGHTVHVYTTTANGTSELPVKANATVLVEGVPVTYFTRITKDNSHISPRLWRQLYKTCRQYDVVHIHSWWNPLVIIATLICHAQKVKVIVSPRGMLSDYIIRSTNKRLKKLIHFIGGKKALAKSYFHATSQIEFEECKRLIPGWQGFMLPNIVTLPILPITKSKNDRFTLLFLSRIHPKKGIEFLIEAISKLSQNIILKIAGTGDEHYINKLKEKIKTLLIEDKIEWIGWKDRAEKFDELMKADLFVLLSYNENFANSVIESLYMGTPVFISDKVGLARFVKEKNMGWVTPLCVQDITETLQFISQQKEALQRIETESRSVVEHAFSEQHLIRQYVDQYQQIVTI